MPERAWGFNSPLAHQRFGARSAIMAGPYCERSFALESRHDRRPARPDLPGGSARRADASPALRLRGPLAHARRSRRGVRGDRGGPRHRGLPPRPAGRRGTAGRRPPPDLRADRSRRGTSGQALPALGGGGRGLPAAAALRADRRGPGGGTRGLRRRCRARPGGRAPDRPGGRHRRPRRRARGRGVRAARRGRHRAPGQLPVPPPGPAAHRPGLRDEPAPGRGPARRARRLGLHRSAQPEPGQLLRRARARRGATDRAEADLC